MQYRGVAYYPEAWPVDRWDRDIALMKEAGFNLVRMGEFAWARLEPRESQYSLDWWLDIFERFRKAEMFLLLATPTAAPPAWLHHAYPQTHWIERDGHARPHGGRRHYCPTSPCYRELSQKITRVLAQAVAQQPHVIGWQIDNEAAPDTVDHHCHCEQCTTAFRHWLREKFGNIEALNTAWNNVFWSGDLSDWDEISPPYLRLSWKLDHARFLSGNYASFIAQQAQVLRQIQPQWQLSTNQWTGLTATLDPSQMFEQLDVASLDAYQEYYASREFYSATFDLYRNIKGRALPFWHAETNAWNPSNMQPRAIEALRPWAYLSWAKGADAYLYFRWRQSVMGEEDHPAILDWSGEKGKAYEQIRFTMHEIAGITNQFKNLPLPHAEAAILFHFDSAHLDLLRSGTTSWRAGYREHLVETHATLARLGIACDVLPVNGKLDLSKYKLVVLPQMEIVEPWLVPILEKFVDNGGVLLAQPRLSMADEQGKYLTMPLPGNLTQLFGCISQQRVKPAIRYAASHAFNPSPNISQPSVQVRWQGDQPTAVVQANHYIERLSLINESQPLATYCDGPFADEPSVITLPRGNGQTIYQAWWLDEVGTSRVVQYVTKKANLLIDPHRPSHVDILQRGHIRFYLNHHHEPITLPMMKPGKVLIGNTSREQVELEPYGVCLIAEQ